MNPETLLSLVINATTTERTRPLITCRHGLEWHNPDRITA